MRIGMPFKMGSEWVLQSVVIIGGPFAAPSLVRAVYALAEIIL
jgi:hypothetical protein